MAPKRSPLLAVCALLAVAALFKTGCRTYTDTEGEHAAQLRFHNWWNYYQRATTSLQDDRFEDAKMDFERSLGLRRGAKFGFDEDMWRARTYGLHFVEGYFPNRELGICFYHLGDMNNAISFLQKSMDQTPSGRAKHYLNLARSNVLKQQIVDPPAISLDRASSVVWTRKRNRDITGRVTGKGLVKDININGQPQFIELAEKEISFKDSITLKPGRNVISIEASDLVGHKSTQQQIWVADWMPPQFTVKAVEKENAEWIVKGTCSDDIGLLQVTVNGTPHFRRTGRELRKSVDVEARLPARQQLIFRARDMAGNQIETVLTPDLFASDKSAGGLLCDLAMNDDNAGASQLKNAGSGDRLKPNLRLKGLRTATEVFGEEFFLDGSASDSGGLSGITINGEQLLSKQNHGAISSHFARRLSLEMGKNDFIIIATDLAGNRTVKEISVMRRTPDCLDKKYRLTMGVPPLLSDEQANLTQLAKRLMEEELLHDPIRFHLLERDEGWAHILREQKLSLSDLSDPRSALQIGKMLPADMLLMATLMRDGPGLTVYAKVVETGGGIVLFAEDVYSEELQQDLSYQISGLIMKIEQRFPLLTGNVVERSGNKVTIDVGSTNGARPGMKFIVVVKSEAQRNVLAGEVCKVGDAFVELALDKVKETTGTARILPSEGSDAIREGYYAYAR